MGRIAVASYYHTITTPLWGKEATMAKRALKGGRWEPWEGGRKWIDQHGKVAAFYIRRRVGGQLREIRLPATIESAAHAQLKRFESDPEAFDPAGDAPREGLFLDEDLVKGYLAFSEGEGNSARWRREQGYLLGWWGDRLEGVDLRRASLPAHILPALKRRDATVKHHRVTILPSAPHPASTTAPSRGERVRGGCRGPRHGQVGRPARSHSRAAPRQAGPFCL